MIHTSSKRSHLLPLTSWKKWLPMALLGILLQVSLFSVQATPASEAPYRTATPPVIDGVVDSAFYHGTTFHSFKQIEPSILSEARAKTEIYFMYDQDNIYIAGVMYQDRSTIKASSGRRDSKIVTEGDMITLAIDPLNNGNAANFFVINPSNGIADGVLIGGEFDYSWDGVFHSATRIFDDRWTFEFQLPISSVSFQSKPEQTWGVLFMRTYTQLREKSVNQVADKNSPLRIDEFHKVSGLRNLKQKRVWQATPYTFASFSRDEVANQSSLGVKMGGDIKFRPLPSMSVIATFNPDFAQIETDAVVVNVDDVPVSLPERRPFFTESSDLYPGLAVNTRNIRDINAGVKLRQVIKNLKYDATWVQDKERNHWLLGNARWTNNKTFHGEVISGVKNSVTGTHYNITTNVRGWAYNKRLTFYNWFGTINRPRHRNEFETVNSVQWLTRELQAGVWSHVKSGLYNPNVTGHNTLSNEITHAAWLNYAYFTSDGFVRKLTADTRAERRSLYTGDKAPYYLLSPRIGVQLHISNTVGNWEINVNYRPALDNYFRYRNSPDTFAIPVHHDAFGSFVLVSQHRNAVALTAVSDYSRKIGFTLHYNNIEIRQSASRNVKADMYWKISSKANITYSFEQLSLAGSPYQPKYNQRFNRVKAEYNVTSKLNLRGIVQFNNVHVPGENGFNERQPLLNLTASWQYSRGSFVYLVFNRYADKKEVKNQPGQQSLADGQLIGIKVNKTFYW